MNPARPLPVDENASYRLETFLVWPDSPQMERAFMVMLASLEARCNDRIALAIVDVAQRNGILPVSVTGFQYGVGRGVAGLVQLPDEPRPRPMLAGSRDFVTSSGLEIPAVLENVARQWQSEPGAILTYGGWEGSVRGILKLKKVAVDYK
jgi:cation transport ATPase